MAPTSAKSKALKFLRGAQVAIKGCDLRPAQNDAVAMGRVSAAGETSAPPCPRFGRGFWALAWVGRGAPEPTPFADENHLVHRRGPPPNPSFVRFSSKRALITGAASGIGKAVADALLHEGAHVLSADLAHSTAVLSDGNPQTVHLDVTNEAEWERLSAMAGRLDLLVACAGISDAKPIAETSSSDWRRVLAVNLDGAFLSIKYGARLMPGGGAMVLVGSASGIKAAPGASAYCSSKAGLRMLVRTAALEFKPQGIRINAVSPAGVVTPMWQAMPIWKDLVEKHGGEDGAWNALGGADRSKPSIQRMAFPEEIASAILFLCGDESAHITGSDLVIDGGYTA